MPGGSVGVKNLLKALQAQFAGATLAAAFPGGFHPRRMYERLASTVALPYCVYDVLAAPTDPLFGTEYPYDVAIQFSAYGDVDATLAASMATLCSVFDDDTLDLDMDSGTCYCITRETEPMPDDAPEQKEARPPTRPNLYRWQVVFNFGVHP